MTGFGSADGAVAGRHAQVEIRTVNHRWFNLAARLPAELAGAETELREAMRREFDRGHIHVHVRWVDDVNAPVRVDLDRAGAVVEALRSLQTRFGLPGEVTVDLVARQADVFGVRASGDAAPVGWNALAPVMATAAAACRAVRLQEGTALAAEIVGRLDTIAACAARVHAEVPGRLVREQARLSTAVAALLDGRACDERRVAEEVALAAARLDVTEELVRLGAHLAAARTAIASSQPMGKQLGFLAQELGREVNTIGSKANDATIAHQVVTMKSELEKIREQLENLE